MSVTENVNQDEGLIGVSTENVPGGRQRFNPEQSAPLAQAIQPDCHESGFENESKITLRDFIVSSLLFLSLIILPIVFVVYYLLPSL